jgi:hypothetical protein
MRAVLFIFAFFISTANSQAQNTFFNSLSPSGYLFGMKRLSDGNFVFGNTPTINTAVIVKQDSTGQQIWNTVLPLYSAFVYEIEEATDGGLLILVHASFGPNTCPFVVRLKPNGLLDWVKSYHNTSNDDVKDIVAMPDTGFALTGAGCSGLNYLIRARKDGTVRWEKQYIDGTGGPGFNFTYFVLTDNSSTFTITGGDVNGDLILFKCDTAGNALWLHTFPISATRENTSRIAVTNDGVILTFQLVTWYPTTAYSKAGVARFDNSGNLQWITSYSLPAQAWFNTVVQLSDLSFVMGGSMNNPLDSMYRRALLMGIDQFGQQQWTQAFSDSGYSDAGPQSVYGIIETSGQDMFVIGSGYNNFFGRFTTTGYGACNSVWIGPTTTYLQPPLVAATSMYEIPVSLPMYVESMVCTDGIFNSEFTSCSNVITLAGNAVPGNAWSLIADGSNDFAVVVPPGDQGRNVLIELTDVAGRVVRTQGNLQTGDHIALETADLLSGEYFISVISENEWIFRSPFIIIR